MQWTWVLSISILSNSAYGLFVQGFCNIASFAVAETSTHCHNFQHSILFCTRTCTSSIFRNQSVIWTSWERYIVSELKENCFIPHSKKVPGFTLHTPFCFLAISLWVYSKCCSFLPQFRNMHLRWTKVTKLSMAVEILIDKQKPGLPVLFHFLEIQWNLG